MEGEGGGRLTLLPSPVNAKKALSLNRVNLLTSYNNNKNITIRLFVQQCQICNNK